MLNTKHYVAKLHDLI